MVDEPAAPEKLEIYSVASGELEVVEEDVRTDAEWRQALSDEEYRILRGKGTERAFTGPYSNSKERGVYRCAGCGTDLFSSETKFDSGTGWPSFTRPLEPTNIVEKTDDSLFMARTEVRSRRGDSHLGHVFPDGPAPTGLRYCVNSAALHFIPLGDLQKEGYGEYLKRFSAGSR